MSDPRRLAHPYRIALVPIDALPLEEWPLDQYEGEVWMTEAEAERRGFPDGRWFSRKRRAGAEIIWLEPRCLACVAEAPGREWCEGSPPWDPCEGTLDKPVCRAGPIPYWAEPTE